jgi:hypothetical protein
VLLLRCHLSWYPFAHSFARSLLQDRKDHPLAHSFICCPKANIYSGDRFLL